MSDNNKNSFEVETLNSQSAADAIYGNGLMQTRSPYSTAVQVIKPRNMEVIEKYCLRDAAIAGDSFLYQWEVNEKQKDGTWKKKPLIGLSIGAALSISRNMGNNAVDVTVEERPDSYLFYAAYIDLETGFNLRRAFRQRKNQKSGNYDSGRAEDITFQIGQSKAIRNVCLNAAPVWLTDKVLEAAKNSFAEKVEKEPAKFKNNCVNLANKLSIPLDRLEAKYGKIAGWDSRKIVSCLTDLRTLEDGFDEVNNVFPHDDKEPETKQPEQKKPDSAPVNTASPEVESATIVEEPKEELFNELTPEMPEFWIANFKEMKTKAEAQKFLKDNKAAIDKFTGKTYTKIIQEFEKHEQTLKK